MMSIRVGLCVFGLISVCWAQTYKFASRELFADFNNWNIEVGQSIFGGKQYYTNSEDNVYLQPNNETGGHSLVLQAKYQEDGNGTYTSGLVYSHQVFSSNLFINVRATVPKGSGILPGIRLSPVNSPYGSWPAAGEIDIMETLCNDGSLKSYLTFGGPTNSTQAPNPPEFPNEIDWNAAHYFGVEWRTTYIRFYFDAQIVNEEIYGTSYNEVASDQWFSANENGENYQAGAPFDTGFNLYMNVGVGGPCSTTNGCCDEPAVPASMLIHSVDVWQATTSKVN